jgi:hypothetical protein
MPTAGNTPRVADRVSVTARLNAVLGPQPAQRAGRLQGGYYLLGGLWRLLHARSFERVAGPKPDQFQTDVTAALFAAVGAALIAGTVKSAPQGPARVLAISAPIAVAIIDFRHRRQIRRLFRLEAALEIAFAAAAAIPWRSRL